MFTQPFARKERHNTGIKGEDFFFSLKVFAESYTRAGAVCLQASAHMCLCANVLLGLLGKSRQGLADRMVGSGYSSSEYIVGSQVGTPN